MISTIRKALTAAGFGLAGAIGTAMLDGNLTGAELVAAVGIGLGAGVATYAVPNAAAARKRRG